MMVVNSRSPFDGLAEGSADPMSVVRLGKMFWEILDNGARERWLSNRGALRFLALFFSASPGLAPFLIRHPQLAERLYLEGEVFKEGLSAEEKRRFLQKCKGARDEGELARILSLFRTFHLIRCYTQELVETRPLKEVWKDWSNVARLCIEGALVGCRDKLRDKGKGVRLCVIGMGKLGGEELNLASDIDLIFLYDSTEGVDTHRAHEAAALWTTKAVAALERNTAEGLPFRVDLGLRPGGKDGQLVHTPEAMEIYHQTRAATWERMAMIKARVVAGRRRIGQRCLSSIIPLVFRRYLDYGSLRDIRHLKERVQREVQNRQTATLDVKMARGGIRELEFFVQTLQIVYGGKIPQLRRHGTIEALLALSGVDLVSQTEARSLVEAYIFLRKVEHRLQMVHHSHVHRLPQDDRELRRIAHLMGFLGPEALESFHQQLQRHMERVHAAFEGLLEAPKERERPSQEPSMGQRVISELRAGRSCDGLLREAGVDRPSTFIECLSRILSQRFSVRRSSRAWETLERLLPSAIEMSMKTPRPGRTLLRLERFLESVGPRGGYYALLEENPKSLEYLIHLLGRSEMLARWLASNLEAVEGLIERGQHRPVRSKEELMEELDRVLHGRNDIEERLGRLRAFRSQEILRIGAGQLFGELGTMDVCEELTSLAEAFLEATLREVLRSVGMESEAWSGLPLCIMAMGSFGGRELAYYSDLDVLFLYDGDGKRPSTPPVDTLTRIGQRLISWISVPMREGPGWPLDLRLRPSGSVGPLMVSLESFQRYHKEEGRLWERQSLLKARPCVGDSLTSQRAMEAIDRILGHAPPPDPKEMHSMRIRMERERAGSLSEDEVNLKVGPGGMADLEFLVQYLQLVHWGRTYEMRAQNTLKALQALESLGVLEGGRSLLLKNAYLFLKEMEHRLALVLDQRGTDRAFTRGQIEDLVPMRVPLEGLGEIEEGSRLWSLLRETMESLRAVYLLHFCDTMD